MSTATKRKREAAADLRQLATELDVEGLSRAFLSRVQAVMEAEGGRIAK
jgi:hypothetical protein